MNQPDILVSATPAPLQQYKGELIDKGYSYHEIKEDNVMISIFRAPGIDPVNELASFPPIISN